MTFGQPSQTAMVFVSSWNINQHIDQIHEHVRNKKWHVCFNRCLNIPDAICWYPIRGRKRRRKDGKHQNVASLTWQVGKAFGMTIIRPLFGTWGPCVAKQVRKKNDWTNHLRLTQYHQATSREDLPNNEIGQTNDRGWVCTAWVTNATTRWLMITFWSYWNHLQLPLKLPTSLGVGHMNLSPVVQLSNEPKRNPANQRNNDGLPSKIVGYCGFLSRANEGRSSCKGCKATSIITWDHFSVYPNSSN